MNKLLLIVLFTLSYSKAHAQYDFFLFKQNNKTVSSFYKNSYIAFQLKNKQWQTGYITKIKQDSFWIRPMVVYYNLMNTDTVRFNIAAYSFADVYAMPKKGIKIHYQNGQFQIQRSAGHVHWYWVKSGWLFRAGGIGYAALNIANGLIDNNFSFANSKNQLAVAAAFFLFGKLLKINYKPVLIVQKKYHFQTVGLSTATAK